jgi:phosphoribosyl-AMP cyclohydrolase
MFTCEELRIRQLILDEYRSGSSIEQALANINVSCVFISKEKISLWYKRFESGNTSPFNRNNQHQFDKR